LKQKIGSDHTGTLMLVEELFSHDIYKFILEKVAEFLGCEKDNILRYISESRDHHTMGKKLLQEM